MGEVYRANDTRLGRDVAVKVLPPEAADAERQRRFAREAQMIASLNHPNIVTLIQSRRVAATTSSRWNSSRDRRSEK